MPEKQPAGGNPQKPDANAATKPRPEDLKVPGEDHALSEGRKFDDPSQAPESGDKKTTGNT